MAYVPQVMDVPKTPHPAKVVQRWIRPDSDDVPQHVRLATDGEGWYVSYDWCYEDETAARAKAAEVMADWTKRPDGAPPI